MRDNKEKRSFRLSAFDITVAVTVLLLVVIVGIVSYFGSPARKGPLVAYLYPLDAPLQNIWIAPVNDPSQARPVTDSTMGIFDFGVSPDGHFIAYSERDPMKRMLDIYLLDLQRGHVEQVTDCAAQDAECHTPVFHPDGGVLAYMRQALNRNLENVSPGAPRIWLLDIASRETRPLSDDSQLLGHSPVWSDDGNTIAFFSGDISAPGVMVYNFNPQRSDSDPALNFIPGSQGTVGALSPNGRKLIFPDMVARQGGYFSYLKIVDLNADPPVFTNFTDAQAPIDDIGVDWHPGGQFVTIERRYMDERYTRGYQLYNIDVNSQALTPLLVDEHYSHHYFEWNQAGDYLLMQRIPLLNEDGTTNPQARPEIWVLHPETGNLTLISEQAFYPRWVLSG